VADERLNVLGDGRLLAAGIARVALHGHGRGERRREEEDGEELELQRREIRGREGGLVGGGRRGT
jgi:hypothetical protein